MAYSQIRPTAHSFVLIPKSSQVSSQEVSGAVHAVSGTQNQKPSLPTQASTTQAIKAANTRRRSKPAALDHEDEDEVE